MRSVAALYVATGGVYFGLDGVDPWDAARDARTYAGPHPVVAHPPCERWGRYWHGGPSVRVRKILGEDDGCFAAALASVREYGGVLEHPEASAAWRAHGLTPPPKAGGWFAAGDFLGYTCCVEQGHYGHRARKATWLYVVGARELPSLVWGPSVATAKLDEGYHSAEERLRFRRLSKGATQSERDARNARLEAEERRTGKTWCTPERLTKRERSATPIAFRDLLISIARATR